ncbi:MAG: EVE domain-containing protein [Maricaulaceae bacterium]|jgi:predicted RNA-binding protein with PUA-like domain
MAYWLIKSEPETWSWDQQVKRGAKGEHWDGVRNYQARNNMRAMKKGDRCLFYHSGSAREVVGVVEVIREAYPDPTATEGDWDCVDVKAVAPFAAPVTLAQVKADSKLKDMVLVNNSRLSVQPVTGAEWARVCKLGAFKG